MKRILLAAVAVAALAAPASADYWNGSGFPLDHNFHSPFDNAFGRGGGGVGPSGSGYAGGRGPHIIHVPDGYDNGPRSDQDPEAAYDARTRASLAAEALKTRAARVRCDPVILYTDAGRVVQPADGCLRE